MVGKTNAGGGAAGATLVITGVVGHSVTASNGSKTYTRTIDSTGKAVIKGLSTGTWTLTMTGDGQTATRTVDVNADYAVTITYFIATINVTYPAGSTCKATHTDGTVLNAPDTSGTWALVVGNTGTWTISSTNGSQSDSENVSITNDGQVTSVTLTYFAATISVTYPANSTCVVTNSSGQSVAGDTNAGSSTKAWTAIVGATGTYTVTAISQDGSGRSKSQTVSITTEGQVESVTLSYELVLLSGTIGRDNWNLITSGNDPIIFNDYGIVSTNTGYSSAGVTKSRLNVANYNTLKVDFNLNADSNNDVLIGITESRNSFEGINASYIYENPGDYDFVANSKNRFPTAGNYSLSLNLSAVSGTFYIWVYRRYGSTCTFYNIQLLPN